MIKSPTLFLRYFSILFLLSGFAAIVYESVWVQYFKILTGHSAFAQTFVLIVFLGGLSIGSWIGGLLTHRAKRLLLLYAFAEALIGIMALLFHPVFEFFGEYLIHDVYTDFATGYVELLKWGFIVALILPPTILLGTTFPIVTASFQNIFPNGNGKVLAQFYFVNSMGASIGILVCAFFLIPEFGLPGSMFFAGILNLVIAVISFLAATNYVEIKEFKAQPKESVNPANPQMQRYLFLAAIITGLSSFMYQIGWIRMLSMVLGSSVQAFELMLSAFIFGLALGAWYIKSRIDNYTSLKGLFIRVQVLMGAFVISSLLIYNNSFWLMEWLMKAVERNSEGYFIFNLGSHFIAFVVMLPATICAGIILPVIIKMAQNNGGDQKVIGKIYALDTAGGIVGIALATFVMMPVFGLKVLMVSAGLLDVAVGLGLIYFTAWKYSNKLKLLLVLSFIVIFMTIFFVHLNPIRMASGVFRYGNIVQDNKMLFHKDGRTATIAVFETVNGNIVLTTNGKPDASINTFQWVSGDESTQVLLALLPMSSNYDVDEVAIIGLGCGKTAHTALMNYNVKNLDVIEIEPAVVEAAKYFRPFVDNIFNDFRYHLQLADARSYLSRSQKKYELIISEPSNPWVSGMASLFSDEFYKIVADQLSDDGLFVQWIQTYEMSLPLMASIVKAFSAHFIDYHFYFMDDGDVALIGKKTGFISPPGADVFKNPGMKFELAHLGIHNENDLLLRFVGSKQILNPLFNSYPVSANSDYFPYLEYEAPRIRFLGSSAGTLMDLLSFPAPVLQSLTKTSSVNPDSIGPNYTFALAANYRDALNILDVLINRDNPATKNYSDLDTYHKLVLQNFMKITDEDFDLNSVSSWELYLEPFIALLIPYLSPNQQEVFWQLIFESRGWNVLPGHLRNRILLYCAAGKSDYHEILKLNAMSLTLEHPSSDAVKEYQRAVTVWALLMIGKNDEAFQLYEELTTSESENIMLRFLGALSKSKQNFGYEQ